MIRKCYIIFRRLGETFEMTIKEVEQITGLARSNIRFYEKENLIRPARNPQNGYREYSGKDVETIRKIAFLRTLGISVDDIRRLSDREINLNDVIKSQRKKLEQQLSELENAKVMCDKMLSSSNQLDYDDLDIGQYVTDIKEYWNVNSKVFKLDTVRFFYMWGGNITWGLLAAACLLAAVLSFGILPAEIPIQWSGDAVSSLADKKFIFAFPVACLIIRFVLRPFIWRWLSIDVVYSDSITNYITNYLCFIALSVEIFIILYTKGIMKSVTAILFVDTFVFIGLLIMAIYKIEKR